MEDYFLGLDMGTSSLGWALTDKEYNLIRRKGKDLWGVRLFEEASTSSERRGFRVNRRLRRRKVERIGILKSYFENEINKVDPNFYARLDESFYHKSDKMLLNENEKNDENYKAQSIFNDKNFKDKDYFKKYPTIFHLRKELIENKKDKFDVRLVYLAVLNIFKNRGHFLSNINYENEKEDSNISNYFENLFDKLTNDINVEYNTNVNISELIENITKEGTKNDKKKIIKNLLYNLNDNDEYSKKIIDMTSELLIGSKTNVSILAEEDVLDEDKKDASFSFDEEDVESKIETINFLSSEIKDYIKFLKEIYDKIQLDKILAGKEFLSFSRVESYEKHKQDLQLLKEVFRDKKIFKSKNEFNNFFRIMNKNEDNYSAYIGSVNSKIQKERRIGKELSREDLYKNIKNLLKDVNNDERVIKILKDIDNDNFLLKQKTRQNGVIPNQVHYRELKIILDNASKYLNFLNVEEKLSNGKTITVKQKILDLFKFQIPYYIGPLSNYHEGKGGNAWVVRKEKGQVLPWNFSEKIDEEATREKFIDRMLRTCTYMNGEKVLPKNSFLYQKYIVLNDINTLSINDKRLSVQEKQDLFNECFLVNKKINKKIIVNYLKTKNLIKDGEEDYVGGVKLNEIPSLNSYHKYKEFLGDKIKKQQVVDALEEIIYYMTIYQNDFKMVKSIIDKKYDGLFSDEEFKRIKVIKHKDWGNFSRKFLENIYGVNKETGEKYNSIIEALWNDNLNLQELLTERFTFKENMYENISKEHTIKNIQYDDIDDIAGYTVSKPVKRMIWQTLLVLKDVMKVCDKEPKKIFVEMTRGDDEKLKGKDSVSRKKKIDGLYEAIKNDKEWYSVYNKLKTKDNDYFKIKKVYLYLMQNGKCMYTGEPINLNDLFNENMYDIDHIYPQHYTKDDNIDNNLVLSKKSYNNEKQDTFPIKKETREKQREFWKMLHDRHFMNDEKYKRLTRSTAFTDEDLEKFVARQLVETSQGTKAITDVLKAVFDSEIVYSKGRNVSDFRKDNNFLKVREVNDFHHAEDAYLNIVVGNVYNVKFTKSPMNFIKEYRKNLKDNEYHFKKMFLYDVKRGNETAWEAKDNKSLNVVKNVMNKTTPLITRMTHVKNGGISKATIIGKKEAKEGYLPLKNNKNPMSQIQKYGGYSDVAIKYYFLVEFSGKKEREKQILTMPIYKANKIKNKDDLLNYCRNELDLKEPRILIAKIPVLQLIKYNGTFLYISGKTKERFLVYNAVPLKLKREYINYIKSLQKIVNSNSYEEQIKIINESNNKKKMLEVSSKNNIDLYDELLRKHTEGIYSKKPNPLGEKLLNARENFAKSDIKIQAKAIINVLNATALNNFSVECKEIGLNHAPMDINSKIKNDNELKFIFQSPSGIFEKVVDIKEL